MKKIPSLTKVSSAMSNPTPQPTATRFPRQSKEPLPKLPQLPESQPGVDVLSSLGHIWEHDSSIKTARLLYMPLLRSLQGICPEIDWTKLELWIAFFKQRRRINDRHSYLRREDVETFLDYMLEFYPVKKLGDKAMILDSVRVENEFIIYFVKWDKVLEREIIKRSCRQVSNSTTSTCVQESSGSAVLESAKVEKFQLPEKTRRLIGKFVDDGIERVTRAMIAIHNVLLSDTINLQSSEESEIREEYAVAPSTVHEGENMRLGQKNIDLKLNDSVAPSSSSKPASGSNEDLPGKNPDGTLTEGLKSKRKYAASPENGENQESMQSSAYQNDSAFEDTYHDSQEGTQTHEASVVAAQPIAAPLTPQSEKMARQSSRLRSYTSKTWSSMPEILQNQDHCDDATYPGTAESSNDQSTKPKSTLLKPASKSSDLLSLVYKLGTPIGPETTPHIAMFAEQRREREKEDKENILKEYGVQE